MHSNKVIEVKDLTKNFGSERAVDGLSFDVYKGDIFAFLGSNGSGKTTTIRCILDIYQQEKGEALIKGKKFNHSMNSLIGYLPEERGLYIRAKVQDLFMYFAALRDIPKNNAMILTKKYLKRVNLYSHKDKKISQLSSGMQQKVQLGLAMLHNPEVLLLDEPFKGLDPVNRQMYIDLFKELKAQGTTILYSTHVIDEAQKLSDRLVIISKGKRKVYGAITDVRKKIRK